MEETITTWYLIQMEEMKKDTNQVLVVMIADKMKTDEETNAGETIEEETTEEETMIVDEIAIADEMTVEEMIERIVDETMIEEGTIVIEDDRLFIDLYKPTIIKKEYCTVCVL